MRLFELNDVVSALAGGMALPRSPAEALVHQVTLAWYLRQRGAVRSADRIEALAASRRSLDELVLGGPLLPV